MKSILDILISYFKQFNRALPLKKYYHPLMEKIFVTRNFFPALFRQYQQHFDFQFWDQPSSPTQEQIAQRAKGAFGILAMLSDPIDAALIGQLSPELKIIANYAVGTDNIDLRAAKEQGIIVTNTPDVLTDAVCELAIGMLLGIARDFINNHQLLIDNQFTGWQPAGYLGYQLKGKQVGIVGMGRIGSGIAQRLRPFGCKICYFNRSVKKSDLTYLPLEQLAATSDFLILCCSLTPQTHHLINRDILNQLSPQSFIINIGRGALIDEQALIECLQQKRIKGAALDVYEQEPFIPQPLRQLQNVLLLPHIGSATFATREEMLRLTLNNLLCVAQNRPPLTPV